MMAVQGKSLATNSPVDGREKPRMRLNTRWGDDLLMVAPAACGTRVPVFLMMNIGISTLGPLACVRIVLMPSRL